MLNTHRHLPLGLAGHKYQMDFISDVVINLLAYVSAFACWAF